MLLAEGIRNSSTIDKREMNIFFNERRFWRNVLERLIDIALFLSERNLAFRGSEEVLGSPHNGNFLGIFELLARRDPILKELQDRIKNKNTKDHYLSPTIQNELIELLATEVEKENLQQMKLAKYFFYNFGKIVGNSFQVYIFDSLPKSWQICWIRIHFSYEKQYQFSYNLVQIFKEVRS